MRRVIISTIGASLLINQINRAGFNENDWYTQLRDTANLSDEVIKKYYLEILAIIQTLENRALSSLKHNEISKLRASSVELNGIYGLYQEQLNQVIRDIQYLITTDRYRSRKNYHRNS